jgi:Ca2+-transporting ATPase
MPDADRSHTQHRLDIQPYVFIGSAGLVLLQAGFVHLPVMQAEFRTADLTAAQWAVAAVAGALVAPIVGVEKWWRHRATRPGAGQAASP